MVPMKRLIRPQPAASNFMWGYDVTRLVRIAAERGYTVSFHDAQWAWEEHSEDFAAGWLILHVADDDNFAVLRGKLEEVDDVI